MQTARSGEMGAAIVVLVAVGSANWKAQDMACNRVTSSYMRTRHGIAN